jgi:hypothetical protein
LKISNESLKNKYAATDDELLKNIYLKDGLTEEARSLIKEELCRRDIIDKDGLINSNLDEKVESSVEESNGTESNDPVHPGSMQPYLYLGLFIIPIIFLFLINTGMLFNLELPNLARLVLGVIPLVGILLFINKAYLLLHAYFDIRKPKFLILLLIPFVNMVYQYWCIFPLGRNIRKAISKSEPSPPILKFRGFASELCCHLFILMNVAVQIVVQYNIPAPRYSAILSIANLSIYSMWFLVAGSMLYDYSKLINRLTDSTAISELKVFKQKDFS